MTIGYSEQDCELKTQFDFLVGERSYLENRWEDYAGWTLPYLFPHLERENTTEMQNDYQALGAQALNHLANKIVMTLFPPSRPFFKIQLTPDQAAILVEQGFSEGDLDIFTSRAEQQCMRNADQIKLRTAAILAVKNLICLGNSLMYYPEDKEHGAAQVYHLRDYVLKRDMSGDVLQIITRDRKSMETLPAEFRTIMMGEGFHEDQKVDLYTGITLQPNGSYFVKQEIDNRVVSTTGQYPADEMPWTPLTWNLVRGQDYGNGLVEEYAGDFHVISSISEAVVHLAAIASDIKILVNPMGQTDVDALNQSEPGTYVHGLPTDVAFLQLEKMAEFSFITNILDTYERRISAAFLLNTQVTRDAERVTAEEIRMNMNQLEASMGGVYSRLGEDMQKPLATKLLQSVNKDLASMNPMILTGVESLSRNSEHDQIMLFLQDLGLMANIPEPMIPFLKYDDIAKVLCSNRGLEFTKLLKTTEEVQKEQEANQAQNEAAIMGEEAAAGAGQQMGVSQT